MVAKLVAKPVADARRRIEQILSELHLEHFGVSAKVRVKDRGYKDYLDLVVTSRKFQGMLPSRRASLVGSWLRKGLTRSDYIRVASLLPLTPAEERRLPGNGH